MHEKLASSKKTHSLDFFFLFKRIWSQAETNMIIGWFTTMQWSSLNNEPEINKFTGVSDGPIVCFYACCNEDWCHDDAAQ
jgi:hypothetical protein